MKNLFNLFLCVAVLLATCESIPVQEASPQSNPQIDQSASLKETVKTKRGIYHGSSLLAAHAPLVHAPLTLAAPAPILHAPVLHPAPIAVAAAPIIKSGATSYATVRTYHTPIAVATRTVVAAPVLHAPAPIIHAPAITALHAPVLHAPALTVPTLHAPLLHAPFYH